MTLQNVTHYDVTTGKILGSGFMDDEAPSLNPNQATIPGIFNGDTHYFNLLLGIVNQRGPLEVEQSATTITLGQSVIFTLLPVPCEVFVQEMGFVTVDDGVLEITPQSVGEYFIEIDHVHFLWRVFEFEVTA